MPRVITDCKIAADALNNGQLVAFPTETVYGLGAVAACDKAVKKVYTYKNRPRSHPLILHLAHPHLLADWCDAMPDLAQKLSTAYMPGPLTLLLPKKSAPLAFMGNNDYIGLRVPAHPVAHQLLKQVSGGVVAPSANRFGYISPTTAAHVTQEFSDKKDLLILDGGSCPVGIESTIVGFVDDNYFIARPGDIHEQQMAHLLGKKAVAPPDNIVAPGVLKKHYSPKKHTILCHAGEIDNLLKTNNSGEAVAILAFGVDERQGNSTTWLKRAPPDAKQYARTLYKNLREMDNLAVKKIVIEIPPLSDEWIAVHNRLQRAAH